MIAETVVPLSEYERSRGRKSQQFKITNANTIMSTDYPPMRQIIPGYVTEGLSLLAGRQKLGKTWLALDWSIAVATGGISMGVIPCDPGNVLYVDLENGLGRIKRRIETVCPSGGGRNADLGGLDMVTEAPALDKGFLSCLEAWRSQVSTPRLVVIDVLQRVKPVGTPGRNAYENDYAALSELQQWAVEHHIAVVALMHTRKGGADDPLEAVSGSNGMSACADSTLVLDKAAGEVTLYVRGRDIEETESLMRFDAGQWLIRGDADKLRRSNERDEILSVLYGADEPMTPNAIAIATGKKRNAVDQMLYKLKKAGEVENAGRGLYRHAERSDLAPTAASADHE